MALTKDQIFKAADELAAGGQPPTLAKVRAALGGGSFTTISEVMTEWKAHQAAKTTPATLEPPPEAVAQRTAALSAEIWTLALTMANARLAGEREALEAARAETDAARREAAELADQVAGELETVKTRCAELSQMVETSKAEAQASRAELASVAERAAIAEARATEIEHRADDLKSALNIAQETAKAQGAELMEIVKKFGFKAAKDE
jgi:chromosome segregation ATPase